MVNTNRIVPVKATDLISLYSVILNTSVDSLSLLQSADIGDFNLATASTTNYLANEPVEKCNVGSGVTANIYFVPAYNFEGFTREGVAFTVANNGVTIEKDGYTLYKASLNGATCTYTKAGL